MPQTTKGGGPVRSALPDPAKRSPKSAQETFAKAQDNAVEQYGGDRRAHQVASAAREQTHEKG